MPYAFDQLRVHFIEHTVRRVWHEGNAADAVIQAMRSELQQELTDDDHLELRDRVNFLGNETEKRLVALNVIEAEQEQLPAQEIARLTQMLRLRRDLSVNWVGARMVLDMSQESARLKTLLKA
jgi:hypothetical protein